VPKLDEIPYHDEIEEEHYRAYNDISYKLYDIFMSLRKSGKLLIHIQIM